MGISIVGHWYTVVANVSYAAEENGKMITKYDKAKMTARGQTPLEAGESAKCLIASMYDHAVNIFIESETLLDGMGQGTSHPEPLEERNSINDQIA